MSQKDEQAGSGFWAFWRSLPGILTGVAAVITAAAALGALFVGGGGDGTESPTSGAAASTEPTGATPAGDGACFGEYFKGIPQDRVGSVEAGAQAYDVITENQPKAGTIGMAFTNNARSIGAIRFAFFPANRFFKIESIVDAQCKPIEDYRNLGGGDKHVAGDSSTVRLRIDGRYYDQTPAVVGASSGSRSCLWCLRWSSLTAAGMSGDGSR
jgi:hypothetical protein